MRWCGECFLPKNKFLVKVVIGISVMEFQNISISQTGRPANTIWWTVQLLESPTRTADILRKDYLYRSDLSYTDSCINRKLCRNVESPDILHSTECLFMRTVHALEAPATQRQDKSIR